MSSSLTYALYQEAAPVEDVYSNEEHPSVMQNRQENLVRQLLQQQKELQNLEVLLWQVPNQSQAKASFHDHSESVLS